MPAMLTFRRAFLIAVGVTIIFLLLRQSHSPAPDQHLRGPEEGPLGDFINEQAPKAPITSANAKPPSGSGLESRLGVSKEQVLLSDISKKPLKQQLAYYFPYEPAEKFPAYIWQTWRETPASSNFPTDWRPFEASWSELHPGFVHEVITDDAAIHVLRHLYSAIPDVVEAYSSLPHPVLKADFFRYLILLARGGIYTDIDTYAIKSVVEWVPSTVPRSAYGLVIGIEADPDREDWQNWYARRIQFCQWTIQAKPGHPVLREIVVRITEETLRRKREGSLNHYDLRGTMEFTGPAVWTDEVFEYMNNPEYFDLSGEGSNITWRDFTGIKMPKKIGDVVVLPITCFSPGVQQMGAGEPDDPMAYVKHDFWGSWKPEGERHIGEEQQKKLALQLQQMEQQEQQAQQQPQTN